MSNVTIKKGQRLDYRRVKHPEFAARLQKAVSSHPAAPQGHGQQIWLVNWLANQLNVSVSPEAVRKWFHGESRPSPEMLANLARALKVDEVWLSNGSTPVETKVEFQERIATESGAVNVMAGLIQLAGGHISFPEKEDQFDLLAIIQGKTHRIEIVSPYLDPAGNSRIAVKPDYRRRTLIIVEKSTTPMAIQAWHVPVEMLDQEGSDRGGFIDMEIQHDRLREIVDPSVITGKEPKVR